MKKTILFLITTTTFTNVSFASFPVVEKVSYKTTGSMTDPLFASSFYISGIVVFILLVFLAQYSKSRLTKTFKYFQIFGWRVKVRVLQGPWWLILSSLVLSLYFIIFFVLPLLWMALYFLIIEGNF